MDRRLRDRLAARLARLIFGHEAAIWLAPVMARALPGTGVVLAASLAAAALGLAMPMLTRQVIDAGKALRIGVHDHLVVGRDGVASFRSLGLI